MVPKSFRKPEREENQRIDRFCNRNLIHFWHPGRIRKYLPKIIRRLRKLLPPETSSQFTQEGRSRLGRPCNFFQIVFSKLRNPARAQGPRNLVKNHALALYFQTVSQLTQESRLNVPPARPARQGPSTRPGLPPETSSQGPPLPPETSLRNGALAQDFLER